MGIQIRRDAEIYEIDGEWFRARWHFSFDRYRDPENMGWGNMRVFNDDRLIPGAIWPMHPHRDIEGLTYVVEGTFRHQDDVGGPPGMLPAGSVQRMTLGAGAWHSEQNGSETEPLRFIQMWILPRERGLEPGVEQKVFTREDRTERADPRRGRRLNGELRVLPSDRLSSSELREVREIFGSVWGADFSPEDWSHMFPGAHFLLDVDGRIVSHGAVVERELRSGHH